MIYILRHILIFTLIGQVIGKSCSGHDGCKGIDMADTSLTCNGGERCCKDSTFTCTGNSCTVTITGGGHDQFRGSTLFAMDSTALVLNVPGPVPEHVNPLKFIVLCLVIVSVNPVHLVLKCIVLTVFSVLLVVQP